VAEALEHLDLFCETLERPVVLYQAGPHDLDHDERVQLVVPCQVRLVAKSASEQFDRAAAGDERIALAQAPPRLVGIFAACDGMGHFRFLNRGWHEVPSGSRGGRHGVSVA
jgi:hypothetical protein